MTYVADALIARTLRFVGPFLFALTYTGAPLAAESSETPQESSDAAQVELFFFWSASCRHCLRALPFVESLSERYAWLELHSLELTKSKANVHRYVDMAKAMGQDAGSVPAFIFCETFQTGYDSDETTGRFLESQLLACRERPAVVDMGSPSRGDESTSVHLPVLGAFDPTRYSLPILTVVLAGLDSFNPCAFFVLLFLLSLLVHARSRARILGIGGVFVFFSGFIYFLFMAAWLNIFLVVGQVRLVTIVAGAVAVTLAALNVKEYFWFKRGPSLTIPEAAKPGLFQRMRGLVSAESIPTMVVGTVALAVAANTYELLCTAGFPMVYTRVLTLSNLSTASYYLYLLFYNIVYVIPLLAFVALFAVTLGSRKLGEREGRVLKLLAGLMMLQLGAVLLIRPEMLNSVLISLVMLAVAVLGTFIAETVRRRHASSTGVAARAP